jgi:hypothetical protein
MKQIIKSIPDDFIRLSEIPAYAGGWGDADDFFNQFFGVEFAEGGRAYIRKNAFSKDDWQVYALDCFSEANSHNYTGEFEELISSLLEKGHKVFVFEKLSELALWMEETA